MREGVAAAPGDAFFSECGVSGRYCTAERFCNRAQSCMYHKYAYSRWSRVRFRVSVHLLTIVVATMMTDAVSMLKSLCAHLCRTLPPKSGVCVDALV